MKPQRLIWLGVVAITGCASLPENAPLEFKQAQQEIEKADDEDVDDIFSRTLTRAQQQLDGAVALYENAEDYRDPTAQAAKRMQATAQAAEARDLASNAREAYRKVHAWDSDMEVFTTRKVLEEEIDEVKQSLDTTTAALEKTKQEQAPSDLRLTTAVAYFETGKASLEPDERQKISEIARTLHTNPSLNAYVVGYTDPRGSKELNRQLAAARAATVAQELVANEVDQTRIKIRPYGEYRPDGENVNSGEMQLERKVEIRLMPDNSSAEQGSHS